MPSSLATGISVSRIVHFQKRPRLVVPLNLVGGTPASQTPRFSGDATIDTSTPPKSSLFALRASGTAQGEGLQDRVP
jgi:hypothetical protein